MLLKFHIENSWEQKKKTKKKKKKKTKRMSLQSIHTSSTMDIPSPQRLVSLEFGKERVFSQIFLSKDATPHFEKERRRAGSGVGLCGLAVAIANGANVTLTDLPSVVEGILMQNIEQNSTSLTENGFGVIGTHGGLARAIALNWEKPMACYQLTASEKEVDAIDVIIAAECIWLADLLDCFCESVEYFV